MSVDYKKIEFALHESLVKIENGYKLLEYDESLLESVRECMDLVKTKRYSVAVMGEFKRGKSSLINALLGSKILPADVTPTTATINRITFAPSPKAVITYKDNTTEEIGINDLAEYTTKLSADGESRALSIKEATIYFPTQICQNHVDIIDTPGLNDEERMTKITIDMLENVDAVIVPIHARSPFSATETGFVCQLLLSENVNNIVFVIGFMDQLDEDDYELESFLNYVKDRIKTEVFSELKKRTDNEKIFNKAHSILDGMSIFPISAALALKSFVTNNRADLKKSGFEEFGTSLLHIVTAKQIENTVKKSTQQIDEILSQMDSQNEKRLYSINSEFKNTEDTYKAALNHDLKKKFIALFTRGNEHFENFVNNLNAMKNISVSAFIKSLSSVKENTHNVIDAALTNAAIECNEKINSSGVIPARQNILDFLAEEMKCIDVSENFIEDILNFAKYALEKIKFSWKRTVIPNAHDLTQFNVIDYVVDAIDFSVNDLKKQFDDTLTEIRKNCFTQADEESKKMIAHAEDVYNSKNLFLDRKVKAQIHNYEVFANESKEILIHCDKLRAEILKIYDWRIKK
jgi:predicted GTPase